MSLDELCLLFRTWTAQPCVCVSQRLRALDSVGHLPLQNNCCIHTPPHSPYFCSFACSLPGGEEEGKVLPSPTSPDTHHISCSPYRGKPAISFQSLCICALTATKVALKQDGWPMN